MTNLLFLFENSFLMASKTAMFILILILKNKHLTLGFFFFPVVYLL